jgi:hypothetical protein
MKRHKEDLDALIVAVALVDLVEESIAMVKENPTRNASEMGHRSSIPCKERKCQGRVSTVVANS